MAGKRPSEKVSEHVVGKIHSRIEAKIDEDFRAQYGKINPDLSDLGMQVDKTTREDFPFEPQQQDEDDNSP